MVGREHGTKGEPQRTGSDAEPERKETYQREVKSFGDGGAHITVPSELVGETVEVTRVDWDDELGGEIIRAHGTALATEVEAVDGTAVYAPPTARTGFRDHGDMLQLGVVHDTRDDSKSPGDEYTVPMHAMLDNVAILGNTGHGKMEFLRNIVYQYAMSDVSNGFCVVGDVNGGIGDITSLLQARNIDFTFVDTELIAESGGDVVTGVLSNLPVDKPLVLHVPLETHDEMPVPLGTVIDGIAQERREFTGASYPVFIDRFTPDMFTEQQLTSWNDCGVNVVASVQYPDQLRDGVRTWVLGSAYVFSFGVTPQTASTIATDVGVDDCNAFVGRVSDLPWGEFVACDRGETVVKMYPETPP